MTTLITAAKETSQHVVGFVTDLFFSTLESGFFFSGFVVEFAESVWTVAISEKKKLRLQKNIRIRVDGA